MPGTYIALRVHPESEILIREFMVKNNIPIVYPGVEARRHITLMSTDADFSKEYNNYETINPQAQYYLIPEKFEFFPTKEGNNCLVLRVSCPELANMHDLIKLYYNCQAHHGEFKPHISFSYDVGRDLKLEDIPPFTAPIIVGEEYCEPFNDNWARRK